MSLVLSFPSMYTYSFSWSTDLVKNTSLFERNPLDHEYKLRYNIVLLFHIFETQVYIASYISYSSEIYELGLRWSDW